jgi:hypothetical protein
MPIANYERYSEKPGPIRPREPFLSACRKGYYDYCLQGPGYAQAYKRVAPHLAWAYETGALAAQTCQGLAKALYTLTLPHTPGVSYSYWDGLKTNKAMKLGA